MINLYTYNPHVNKHTLKDKIPFNKFTYNYLTEYNFGYSFVEIKSSTLDYLTYVGFAVDEDNYAKWYNLEHEKFPIWQEYMFNLRSQVYYLNIDNNIIGYKRVGGNLLLTYAVSKVMYRYTLEIQTNLG